MEVAERIFAEQGFGATRMQDIATAAGVSLATLYQSFPGKEELHRSLLVARDREMLDQVQTRWGGALHQPDDIEHVLLLMETHLHFLLDHPDYLRMQLHDGYAWYSRAAQPTAAEQQMWARGLANIAAVLTWGMQRKLFNLCDPVDQARMLMAAQQTRLANWVMGGMKVSHAEVIVQVQADFVRLCGRPAVSMKLLSDDGAGLAPAAQFRIDALRQRLGKVK